MLASVVECPNAFDLAAGRKLHPVTEPTTVRGWLDAHGIVEFARPTICIHNGGALLRADWATTRILGGDVCVFVALPQGGGGGGKKNPLATVLSLAVMIGAVAAGQVWGADLAIELWGGSGVITPTQALYGTALVTGGVAVAGSALISAVVPAGKPASTAVSASAYPEASPTYSLTATGNQARLGQAVPAQYGRHIAVPDYASPPYQEYVDNDQMLHAVVCLGQGYHEIEQIRIDDTPISSFEEVEYEVVEPGGSVTLIDPQVVTALEVAGQEAVAPNELAEGEDGWVGPFVICDAGDTITSIGIDAAFARGLYYANTSGGFDSRTVTWEVQAQLIDDDGEAVDDWFALGSESVTAATNTPQYRSYKYAVASGRYQARLRRTNDIDTSAQAGHELRWAQARGYLDAAQNWGDKTLLAFKMRATDNLSNRSSRAIKVISTRKIQVWTPETGWSLQASRSLVWAAADVFRAAYGGKVADARLPLAEWAALDAVHAARGDYFDYRFETQTTVWDAAKQILLCGRSVPIQQGGVIRVFRDAPQAIPSAMFTGRNILKSSFSVKYAMPSDDTADAVILEYYSAKTWKLAEVKARVRDAAYDAWLASEGLTDGDAARLAWADLAENPVRVSQPGITGKAHALREADYLAAKNRYRRIFPTFRTEMEGMIPTYGDLASVSYPMVAWGLSGEVIAWTSDDPETDGEGNPVAWPNAVLRLSEPPQWTEGEDHYIALRDRTGGMAGPFLVTPGASADTVALEETLTIAPYVGSKAERTHFSFGPASAYSRMVIITGLRPRRAGQQVEVSGVVDDTRVYVN
ncbi:host specificity factor TipJ family phage tail protein [Oleispirillum naphthae]|uniref:host specificity factor TipJ family phage tail protein n=1 Tax=Oleispirillum naphthae TaxID=2838853 RepID=UPI003082321C